MKKYDRKLKTLGPTSARLVTALYDQGETVFDADAIQRVTDLKRVAALSLINKLIDRGIACRLKPGLYALVPFELGSEREYLGNPLILVPYLGGAEAFASHGTAMDVHQMLTQPQLTVWVSTSKPRPPLTVLGTPFRFVLCPKAHLFGVMEHWVTKQVKVRVSDLERTVIDGVQHPRYCGGIPEVAKGLWIRRRDLHLQRLLTYALRLKVGAVYRRLGFLLELYEIGTPEILDGLRAQLTVTFVPLDPSAPQEGLYLRRWRLRLNVSPEELRALVRT